MRRLTISLYPLPDMFIRFIIITIVAVVWCSLSIPVEGVVEKDAEENLAGMENCLKAIQEVQEDPKNGEMVKRFINLCKEFIDEMDLSENQTAILEQAGYKRSKKSKSKAKENETGDKEVTDKKDKTEDAGQKVTPPKKDDAKDPSISDKKDKDAGSNHEVPSAKTLGAGVSVTITHKEDDAKTEKEDIQKLKVNQKMEKPMKNIHKTASKPNGKDEAETTETLPQDEKIPEPETVVQTESEGPYSKFQEKQIAQSEQVQSENLEAGQSPFDFPNFHIPGMAPEELAKTIEDLKEIQRVIKMQQVPQPQVQMHANFPDPTSQRIHESQFGQQFAQGIPQFQNQEWNAQFQDPALAAGIPHMHMPFHQGNGIPKPTFQQGIPPFPQQAEFAEHFQHQHFGHGIPQMPPAWDANFPDQKFGQGIPQESNDAATVGNIVNEAFQAADQQQTIQPPNVAPNHEDLSAKRKVDEL